MKSLNQINLTHQFNIQMPLMKDHLISLSSNNIREEDSTQIVKIDKWTT